MAEMGRPRINIEASELESLCRLNPTQKDAASFFKCSEDTIENFCRKTYDKTFSEVREQNMVHTRLGLVRKAVQLGMGGNTAALIFALKNLCGWKDKQELSGAEDAKPILLAYAPISERNKK